MTETTRFAAAVSGRVGVGEDIILGVILALLQAAPAILAACRPPVEAETHGARLRWLAVEHPLAFRIRCREECVARGVPIGSIHVAVRETWKETLDASGEKLSAMYAEAHEARTR